MTCAEAKALLTQEHEVYTTVHEGADFHFM